MGFPMGCCSELAVPKLLVCVILTLASLRRIVAWLFTSLGLGDLIDVPSSTYPQATDYTLPPLSLLHRLPITPARLQEYLPAVCYEEDPKKGESCAVCLQEFELGEEVRRLPGCRHVFHTGCFDPWVALGRRTCPLCRAPFFDDELMGPTFLDDADELVEIYDDEYGDLDVDAIDGSGGSLSFLSPEELLYPPPLPIPVGNS